MKIIIEGTEKEVANLIKEIRGQRHFSEEEIKEIYKGFCRKVLDTSGGLAKGVKRIH